MKNSDKQIGSSGSAMDRRDFLTTAGAALAVGMLPFNGSAQETKPAARPDPLSIKSNVHMALCQPKTVWSMPGAFPGVVAEVHQPGATKELQPLPGAAKRMLAAGLKALTGEKDPRAAWRHFVNPGERIGIKFNPGRAQGLGSDLGRYRGRGRRAGKRRHPPPGHAGLAPLQ